MKNLFILLIFAVVFAGCSDEKSNPITPDKPFEPTGFMLVRNDSTYIYCNNGELDPMRGDTLTIDRYKGEVTYDVKFLDKDGNTLKDPDPLKYTIYVDVTNRSTIEDKKAFAGAYNFKVSFTPDEQGDTDFLFELKKDDKRILYVTGIPLHIL